MVNVRYVKEISVYIYDVKWLIFLVNTICGIKLPVKIWSWRIICTRAVSLPARKGTTTGHRTNWGCACTSNGVLHSLTLLPGWAECDWRNYRVWFLRVIVGEQGSLLIVTVREQGSLLLLLQARQE